MEAVYQARQELLRYLKGTIRECHEAGIGFCVSGIETSDQDSLARTLFVDWRQGYFYDYPTTAEELINRAREGEKP